MSDDVENELISALQGDRESIQRIAQRLNGLAPGGQVTQEQWAAFDAAVKHRARGVAEYNRFQDHFADVCEDETQFHAAVALDKEMAARYPDMTERDRFTAVGETIRRGFGPDVDHAQAIAAKMARNRREQIEAGEDEYAHKPSAADVAIAESEAEHDAFVSEGMAQLVRGRGPKVLAPLTEEQKLRNERIELERRRRAQGW